MLFIINMKYCKQLLEAEAEARALNCKLDWLRRQALAELREAGTSQICLGEHGKLAIKYVSARRLPKSEAETELEATIQAEQAEMRAANKYAIYQHEKQRFLSDLAIRMLSTNQFIEQMQEKLASESEKAKKKTEIATISVRLPKPKINAFFNSMQKQEVYAWGKELSDKSGHKIARYALDLFMQQYSLGKYGECNIEEAWEQRVEYHNRFWGVEAA